MAVCKQCGLPEELCICESIAREQQKIRVAISERRFGKKTTVISGISKDVDIKSLLKTLKTKLACGGTYKKGRIELQGDHRKKIKKLLVEAGFSEDIIEVR